MNNLYDIELARRDWFAAKALEKLARDHFNIVEKYWEGHRYERFYIDLFEECMDWIDDYYEHCDEHEFIHNSYPEKHLKSVEFVILNCGITILEKGTEKQIKIVRRYLLDNDLWLYNGKFVHANDLPEDYDYELPGDCNDTI